MYLHFVKVSPVSRPIYSHLAILRPHAAGDAIIRAPLALRNLEKCTVCVTLSSESWEQCIWKVIIPLLDALMPEICNLTDPMQEHEQSVEYAWDESKISTLISIGSITIFNDFLVAKIMIPDSL